MFHKFSHLNVKKCSYYACIKLNKNIDLFYKNIFIFLNRGLIFNVYLIIYLNCFEKFKHIFGNSAFKRF
ncbi:hypothetical protein DHC50_11475 [Arenibacter sp. A80]|nr:hypothetical protein [Arenibacter sp. A80]RFT56011.1 hypothetical protein D0S24_11475 [Arenibacter sp. P308M17]